MTQSTPRPYRVGIVSDTHWTREDQFDPCLMERLEGVDLILHAGDVVQPFVLQRLNRIAPIRAVLGNCDNSALQAVLSPRLQLNLDGVVVGMLHGHQGDPAAPALYAQLFSPGLQLLVHGHSHLAVHRRYGSLQVFNPGSASQPRNHLPPTIGRMEIDPQLGITNLRHLIVATGEQIIPAGSEWEGIE